MLKNYLKVAYRSLIRTKGYSTINILGLSLGVACCMLLALYVKDEFEYDRHHDRLNDLYRIVTQFEGVVGFDKLPSVSPPIPMTMKEELAEVEAASRVLNPFSSENLIQYENNKFYESKLIVADSTIFDVLTYRFIEGNPRTALADANTIVVSEILAKKIFGNESALDKQILISQGGDPVNYKITGVYRPNKSFLEVNGIMSIISPGVGEYVRTNPEAS